ncbi:MAG: SIMPL domain-containing protein [Bacteroidia bacterium]|nr:SIMPL domain-containing protein [Bacteroidia bacterium]
MARKSGAVSIFMGISLFLGLVLLGVFIYRGLKTFSDKDRVVTVKGLAEMNMEATSATINVSFSMNGDNVQEILRTSEDKKNAVLAYLKEFGIHDSLITIGQKDVTDRQRYYEKSWVNGKQVDVKIDRYTVWQYIYIKSIEIKKTEEQLAQIKMDLINKDLTSNISANYIFPELNTIKPKLIAESTKNARIAGEQFANDSKAKLGKIKTASQGQITIAGNYYYYDEEESSIPQEPYLQKARVVSTIVFFLE